MRKIFRVVAVICLCAVILPVFTVLGANLAPVIKGNSKAEVDLTNAASGYVTVRYKGKDEPKLKVIVLSPNKIQYTYDLDPKAEYEVFPLTEGDGKYTVGVYTNITGTRYAVTFTTSFNAKLKSDHAPFLVANKYVNYSDKSDTVAKASEIVKNKKKDLEKVAAIYDYVIDFTYDREKAKTVKSGYLPDVDKIISSKKGICFDYAAVMTAMLRSQNIPCQLVIGYAGDIYHAWINILKRQAGLRVSFSLTVRSGAEWTLPSTRQVRAVKVRGPS